jgi:hypothetical protein
MNASDITFGIEIETTIPSDSPIRVGPHGAGLPVEGLNGWLADNDPSIRCGRGRRGCEFVSPVFKGAAGLRQLIADIRKLQEMGATVNASCGLHIHVGFDKNNREAAEKLATLVSNFEKAIYASTGTKNRERGRWCAGLNRHGAPGVAINRSRVNRYHVANFGTVKPTVEFRAFSASLNVEKIVGYVRLCVGMVERALKAKRSTNWTAPAVSPTSPIARNGEGQTALTRLYYQLGWTKGRQPHTFGDLSGDAIPTIRNSKKTLMKLAKKYDGQP